MTKAKNNFLLIDKLDHFLKHYKRHLAKTNRLMTLREMGVILGNVNIETFRRYVRDGVIPHFKIGKKYLFDACQVKNTIKEMIKKAYMSFNNNLEE